jgi:tetratricopeptide (TPR) repeat protein
LLLNVGIEVQNNSFNVNVFFYLATIKVMPHTFDARKEMLDKCRSYYSGNQSELAVIDEFERNYNAENAFRWYTKPCFLFRLLNKALRTEDIEVLYTFRYFIMDLSASLKVARDENTIKRVYRGGIMSRDEVEHYSIGTVVANSGFLSTSRNISVAKQFIGVDPTTGKSPCQSREDETQFVLFEIDIDQDLSPDIVLADISGQSFFPDEEEVLFDLGSTFEIIEIDYDCEHYFWLLRMRPSMNGLQLCQAYEAYIRQEITELTPTLLFGTLLTDMGAYEQSAVYFEQLLARIPYDHDDRSKVYCSVARAYRFTDQFEKALGLLQCAEKLQRAKLPESRFDLARTLAGIATVYYELHDYQQELPYYQESMTFFQEIFPENHIEIARSLNRLGFAYANQQQYNTALKYLFKALIVFKNTALSEHPGPAQVLFNLGVIHHVLGHTEISIDFYHKALKMRETALPCNHPHIAQSYYQISVFYKEQHQYDLSLEYAQRALSIYKKKLVPGHKLIRDVQNIIESLPGDSAIR